MRWTPDIILGFIIAIGCLILIACHIDSEVKFILGVAAGWCFGAQYQIRRTKQGGK